MLDIVVPVYNEGSSIQKLFEEIERYIKAEKHVLVVYDYEEDTTIPVIMTCREAYSYTIDPILNLFGDGALNAIKTGLTVSNEEMVLVMMADSSDKLDVVDEMCRLMEKEGYDLICGSRYMRGGRQNGGPFLKGLFSRVAGVSLHMLTGIPTHDCSNSFKLYRRSMLGGIKIQSKGGFEIGLEILVKAYVRGLRYPLFKRSEHAERGLRQ